LAATHNKEVSFITLLIQANHSGLCTGLDVNLATDDRMHP